MTRRTYSERAWRIVDRLLPKLPVVSAFYEPEAFMAAAHRNYARTELFWRTMPRLRAKAEGGLPYIAMPKGADHVFSGGIMERVAREFKELAA